MAVSSLCALVAAEMSAQAAPADTNPGKWIMPGDSLLRGARVATGTFRYLLTAYKDGDEFNVGRIQDQISVDTADGAVRLVRVQRLERGTQRVIDSTWTDFATLMPRRHRSEQPQRRIGIDFAGKKIKATIGQPGAVPAVIDTTLKLAVFDSGNWDLLLRALPLEKGLRVRFLVYDTDAGVHEYRLAVTGTAQIQGEEAYIVRFALSRTSEAFVWMSTTTREFLQMETMLAGNTLLRQVRVREPATGR
ncbi:MAG: hypothetical protein K2R93_20755 [Gemmatimonadaceae bacterium]|nr:hypothetical protein [Gemmatimonadaceae bacterium]